MTRDQIYQIAQRLHKEAAEHCEQASEFIGNDAIFSASMGASLVCTSLAVALSEAVLSTETTEGG